MLQRMSRRGGPGRSVGCSPSARHRRRRGRPADRRPRPGWTASTIPTPRPTPPTSSTGSTTRGSRWSPGTRCDLPRSHGAGGPRTLTAAVTGRTRVVAGVDTAVVHEEVAGARRTPGRRRPYDWYAQDRAGNVWCFGTAGTSHDGRRPDAAGSWQAGRRRRRGRPGDAGRTRGSVTATPASTRRRGRGARPTVLLGRRHGRRCRAATTGTLVETADTQPAGARPRRAYVLRPRPRGRGRRTPSRAAGARRADRPSAGRPDVEPLPVAPGGCEGGGVGDVRYLDVKNLRAQLASR